MIFKTVEWFRHIIFVFLFSPCWRWPTWVVTTMQ